MGTDDTLYAEVARRLDADALDTPTASLVLAAFTGQLDAALRDGAGPSVRPAPATAATPGAEAPSVYLRSLTVEGFRGIGGAATLPLRPGPGLTLVMGRNGSGKSSLAEACEVLFTGTNRRWDGRPKIWRDGWRNLHHPNARITCETVVETLGPVTLVRAWEDDAPLEDAITAIERPGQKPKPIDGLGWTTALDAYRPFLSYNELGSMLDEGPSKLYDALSGILGLDALTTAQAQLRSARLEREHEAKDVSTALTETMLPALRRSGDERAVACVAALEASPPDIDTVEQVLSGAADSPAEDTDTLRSLASLPFPSTEACLTAGSQLREAVAGVESSAGTQAGRALATARLLTEALDLHAAHGDADCPVCGQGALDASWRERTESEVARWTALAADAQAAERALATALSEARALCVAVPDVLAHAADVGIDASEAQALWTSWASAPSDPSALAAHLEDAAAVASAVDDVRARATEELGRREDTWRPLADSLRVWVAHAREAERTGTVVGALTAAERWLKTVSGEVRDARFEPIGGLAQAIWEKLRTRSNVSLGSVRLAGVPGSSQRRVTLDVTVDGFDGSALGVMSQGELNSLALSLFLPRATLQQSPFRFVVIDDPVQSMDPAKVDGLAQVLDGAAQTRQVVVFTHDGRLADAVRRLGIDATVLEVNRRERSEVELRDALTPVRRLLSDAFALVKTDDLDPKIAARVVPGFLRQAIEAACAEVVLRRRLGRGEAHADVDELLASCTRLTAWVALALFDDADRGADVLKRVNKDMGKGAADAYQAVNKGTHTGASGDLLELVRAVEGLCRDLAKLP